MGVLVASLTPWASFRSGCTRQRPGRPPSRLRGCTGWTRRAPHKRRSAVDDPSLLRVVPERGPGVHAAVPCAAGARPPLALLSGGELKTAMESPPEVADPALVMRLERCAGARRAVQPDFTAAFLHRGAAIASPTRPESGSHQPTICGSRRQKHSCSRPEGQPAHDGRDPDVGRHERVAVKRT
jgi:hypothetical protein